MADRESILFIVRLQSDKGCRTAQTPAHNFLGILKLTVQKQDCNTLDKNNELKEKRFSLGKKYGTAISSLCLG